MQILSHNKQLRLLLAAVVAAATWMGCSVRLQWPEHRILVALNASGLADDEQLVTDAGHEIRTDRLAVTIWSIELERCDARPPGMPTASRIDRIRRALSMSTAHAHAERAPNRIWRSQVIELTEANAQTVDLGQMTPSPGQYCRIRVLLQAADEDSTGLDRTPDMHGVSVSAAGQWRSSGATQWQPFDWTSSSTIERVFELDTPLELGEDTPVDSQITLEVDAIDWFADADFEGDEDAIDSRFLGNVRQSISLEEAP